jgi:hypothetical protein
VLEMCRKIRYSKMNNHQHIKSSMLTTDRIHVGLLFNGQKTQSTQDPVKRMPLGGCALFERSHHKCRDTR